MKQILVFLVFVYSCSQELKEPQIPRQKEVYFAYHEISKDSSTFDTTYKWNSEKNEFYQDTTYNHRWFNVVVHPKDTALFMKNHPKARLIKWYNQ
jgi:hypothetical protein